MTLEIKHFDCRLNKWIHTDGNSNNPNSILTEKLDNTLLEAYFPKKKFSFGHIDDKCTEKDLKNNPEGQVLLLSSKTRMLYGEPECLETMNKLCPDRKDRGAYGSIFLGSCQKAVNDKLNVLVVDDETGANGGILPDEVAWKQVGDCHGKVSPQLADRLSNSTNKVIQHRLGFVEENRFGKGTLAPKDLNNLPYTNPNQEKIDLIIPTSSFKGGDKKNNPIQPGFHSVNVWLGQKELSQQGEIALSQLHASFPEGSRDFLKDLDDDAEKLSKIQDDIRSVAKYYCEKYEKRAALKQNQTKEDSETNLGNEENQEEESEQIVYRLIKADLESDHCQILEIPKIVNELKKFLQREWLETAIGKSAKFDRGMIIPSKDLKHGEIYVPWIKEGKEVLNFRSPFLNSNGMCVSKNKKVEDALAPNGDELEGVIVVNDEDKARIEARIEAEKAAGLNTNETVPIETESERQGRDYDGDCIGVADASKFPFLAEEAKLRNLPENAYEPVKKEEKASFFREDGSQPEFEEIAVFMSDSISVGVINNQATAIEALESEIDVLNEYGNKQDKENYVKNIGAHFQKLVAEADREKKPRPIPEKYDKQVRAIAKLTSGELNNQKIKLAMEKTKNLYHSMVGDAGYQNQLAVDIFKSNRAPDMDLIKENQRLLHRVPNYIRDKKAFGMYGVTDKTIEPNGYSPVELMISQANKHFRESKLLSRPPEQFKDLFEENYTPEQFNRVLVVKKEFDQLFGEATAKASKQRNENGPVLVGKTAKGAEIEISNINKYGHPLAFSKEPIDIKLVPNKNKQTHHQLLVLGKVPGEVKENGEPVYKALGTLSEETRKNLNLTARNTAKLSHVELKAPATEHQIKVLFDEAYKKAEDVAAKITPEEKEKFAAAAWHISTETARVSREEKEKFKKISNFVYAAFGDEIEKRLAQLQLRSLQLSKVKDYAPELLKGNNEEINFEIASGEDNNTMLIQVNEEKKRPVAIVSSLGSQLPIGTKGKGKVEVTGYATASIDLKHLGINQPITYGKATSGELDGYKFEPNKKYEVQLTTVPRKPVAKVKLDGKVLGQLDKNSLKVLEDKRLNFSGTKLNLELNSYNSDKSNYVLASSPTTGNALKIQLGKNSEFVEIDFNNQKATLEIEMVAPKIKSDMGVSVKIDNEWKSAGIFTQNQKKSSKALQQAGLWQKGKSFSATITPNYTVAKFDLVPSSIVYPEIRQWPKVQQETSRTSQQHQGKESSETEVAKNAQKIINKIKQKPTMLQRLNQTWKDKNGNEQSKPTLGLVVDDNVAEGTQQWLESQNIPYVRIGKEELDVAEETKRDYTVFRMVEAEVPEKTFEIMIAQCQEVLDANLTDFNKISPYFEKLERIKPNQEIENQNKNVVFASKPEPQNTSKSKVVASILKNFLDVKNVDKYIGDTYTVLSEGKNTINLYDSKTESVKLIAQLKDNDWQIKEDNLTSKDLKYFQTIAPKVEAKLKQQKEIANKVYNKLSEAVQNSPGFEESTRKEIDVGVALNLLKKCNNDQEIIKILDNSENKNGNEDYGKKVLKEAKNLKKYVLAQNQHSQLER